MLVQRGEYLRSRERNLRNRERTVDRDSVAESREEMHSGVLIG
jgi:hypothetical protein